SDVYLVQGPGAPRRLRPFPTRRSSDLSSVRATRQQPMRRGLRSENASHDDRELEALRLVDGHDADRVGVRRVGRVEADRVLDPRDRKSTRLNSSHQITSYAVSCFTKKT